MTLKSLEKMELESSNLCSMYRSRELQLWSYIYSRREPLMCAHRDGLVPMMFFAKQSRTLAATPNERRYRRLALGTLPLGLGSRLFPAVPEDHVAQVLNVHDPLVARESDILQHVAHKGDWGRLVAPSALKVAAARLVVEVLAQRLHRRRAHERRAVGHKVAVEVGRQSS